MYPTLPLTQFAEINPKVGLNKGCIYEHVEMEGIIPGNRYVEARETREYNGGGSKFRSGDTLFARITPCLENGKIAQYLGRTGTEVAFGSTEFWVFRARPQVSDASYLFYLALSDLIRRPAVKSMFGASGRQRADVVAVLDVRVPAPRLEVQQHVGAVLSHFDDLIRNNIRHIEQLEQMTRMIYREWFVKFRFPGQENTDIADSEMGPIPKGWQVQRVTEAVDVDPTTRVPKEGAKPFVSMSGLSHTSMLITDIEEREGNSGSKFRNGDTLFARITPCLENGKTGFVQFLPDSKVVAFGSTEFIVLRSRTLTPEYVYLLARSDKFRDNAIKSMSGASGRQRVQQACFDKFVIARPPDELLRRFHDAVNPMFRLVHILNAKNESLRKIRDLLLPKLITGEVTIQDFDTDGVVQGV